jgi:hypothetical protein
VNTTLLTEVAVAIPKSGVTNEGLVDSTRLPEPVETVTPVPPWITGSVPPFRMLERFIDI